MKKRSLSIILTVFTSAALFAGCGNTQTDTTSIVSTESTELSVSANDTEQPDAVESTEDSTEVQEKSIMQIKAEELADLQNQFNDIDYDRSDFYEQCQALKSMIATYFEDDAKSGKGAWYYAGDSGEIIVGKWEYSPENTLTDDPTQVLWVCYPNDSNFPDEHGLLAYCTANYDESTQLFTNVSYTITEYAMQANMLLTSDGNLDRLHTMQDMIDSLKEYAETIDDNGTPDADEEYVNETIDAREAAKNEGFDAFDIMNNN